MTIPSAQPRGTASDSLMTQINPDNVLAVHGILAAHAEAISVALKEARHLREIRPCGQDPVSLDARDLFQAKIDTIVHTHRAHLEELREAATRLSDAAHEWQLTDDQIRDAYLAARERFVGLHSVPPPPRPVPHADR